MSASQSTDSRFTEGQIGAQFKEGQMKLKPVIRRILRDTGWDLKRYRAQDDVFKRLTRLCVDREIGTFFDVGANEGQFAKAILEAGYCGDIVSFEPTSAAYRRLVANSARYANWKIAERCALGSTQHTVTINLAGNSQSSSVLSMLPRHLSLAPESAYVGTEVVPVVALDDIIDQDFGDERQFALKMDVQGYEHHVLKGCARNLPRIALMHVEMSLCPLYDGESPFAEFFSEIEAHGFRCVGILPGSTDPVSYEMLQVDATFVKGPVPVTA
jgi:FkbM family methyltransferase